MPKLVYSKNFYTNLGCVAGRQEILWCESAKAKKG
jgi:hypothetical protein